MECCSEKISLSVFGGMGRAVGYGKCVRVIDVMEGGQEGAVEVKVENREERIVRLSDSRVHHPKSKV
jgi:hypothetical protein